MQPTAEEREQRFGEIPKDIWAVFSHPDTAKKLFDICKSNGLHIDEYSMVSEIVADILTGWTSTKDFIPRMIKEVPMDSATAGIVAQSISQEVFTPIRESLRKLEAKYISASVDEVELSQEELLRQLENPTPSPLSGRRVANSGEPRTEMDERAEADAIQGLAQSISANSGTDESSLHTATDSLQTEPKGNVIPINKKVEKQRSIMEEKVNNVKVVNTEVDPYRESVG